MMHPSPPNDLWIPEYLHDTLPNAITSFHCNKGLLSKCFDLVSIHSPTQPGSTCVVSMPGDTKFRKRIGEVHLDLDILSETSNQWLIEVKKHFTVKPSQQPSQQMHSKTNFIDEIDIATHAFHTAAEHQHYTIIFKQSLSLLGHNKN